MANKRKRGDITKAAISTLLRVYMDSDTRKKYMYMKGIRDRSGEGRKQSINLVSDLLAQTRTLYEQGIVPAALLNQQLTESAIQRH